MKSINDINRAIAVLMAVCIYILINVHVYRWDKFIFFFVFWISSLLLIKIIFLIFEKDEF